MVYTLAENFIFNFRIYKIFFYLLRFANFSSTRFMFAFTSFQHTKYFQCFVFQSSKQFRSNTLGPYQKFAPIGIEQKSEQFFWRKLCRGIFYLKWRQINILLSCENLSNVCFIIKVPIWYILCFLFFFFIINLLSLVNFRSITVFENLLWLA